MTFSKDALVELATNSENTKMAAEKVEQTLKTSAQLLITAKESMIIAMLKEEISIEMVSHATKTPIEQIEAIQATLQA